MNRVFRASLGALFILALTAPCATAKPASKPNAQGVMIPAPGSALRHAIMDALRVLVQKEVGQKVVFYDVTLRVKRGWAYVSASARDARGGKLKRFDPHIDPGTNALLRLRAGRWRVLDWGIATDAEPLYHIRHTFPQAPRSLFPSLPDEFPGDGPNEPGDGFNNRD